MSKMLSFQCIINIESTNETVYLFSFQTKASKIWHMFYTLSMSQVRPDILQVLKPQSLWLQC